MERGNRQWFAGLARLQGSVIPGIWPRVLVCGVFGYFISLLDAQGYQVSYPTLDKVIPSIVLGLLLVFRTNTAYDRFWEGRKIWGGIINTSRNLARQTWVFVVEKSPDDRAQKQATLRLIVAFAVAIKLRLRNLPLDSEIQELLSPQQFQTLQAMEHPPLEIIFWINDYLKQQHDRGSLGTYQMVAMVDLINKQVDNLGSCERILKTPLPLAYAIHLRQLLLLYCLVLPFQWVGDLGMLTGWVTALVSFTLLGIEEIGLEIENPFGTDPNDLPLDTICATMRRNIEDLMTLSPSSAYDAGYPDALLDALPDAVSGVASGAIFEGASESLGSRFPRS
ncbi:bestrophin family protein [Prochlorothrix hollandica]|uniref:Bestrophin n=1 Tax=Prochlorothrix hollandica PCC 9006 = CALU 1027 TaxID=317619 RepID=A0A0M2Q0Q3_PROHO|nr:hypothetical protein PROH_09325 [Prochlorothrix hollandica PCC 9006 = CALU 1027]